MNQLHLGQRMIFGADEPFGIGLEDTRRHIYVIGQSGTGKTTLLRNLLLQHIYAGHGVALIDPHGDLAADLLDNFPPWRADDLVCFNPGDAELPDFSYIVVVADRDEYVLPWTAFCVERPHQQHKLRKEYEAYWQAQK